MCVLCVYNGIENVHQLPERLITRDGRNEEEEWNISYFFFTLIYLPLYCWTFCNKDVILTAINRSVKTKS